MQSPHRLSYPVLSYEEVFYSDKPNIKRWYRKVRYTTPVRLLTKQKGRLTGIGDRSPSPVTFHARISLG